jgi:UDP-galactopyranose mutase
MKYDFLIVGAGLAGCVMANQISKNSDKKVCLIDSRDHIAGNVYDYFDENNILVQKYGPHIFHTNSKKIFDYLSEFTEWVPYFHKVFAMVHGQKISLPFNLNSCKQLFSEKIYSEIEESLHKHFIYDQKIMISDLKKHSDDKLVFLGNFIYKIIVENYSKKQWGVEPNILKPSVLSRIPFLFSKRDNYFDDTYQCMPSKGFTEMVNNLLKNFKGDLFLNTDYSNFQATYDYLIYTGPIDQYFNYCFGKLPYRSMNFQFRIENYNSFQDNSVINYPNNFDFTRITEFKHFYKNESPKTVICYEYPCEYAPGENEPSYPIPTELNDLLLNKYLNLAKDLKSTFFTGRLGSYQYLNMDQVVAQSLSLFDKKIKFLI